MCATFQTISLHYKFVKKIDIFQSCQVVIRNESEILNVGMSKPPKVASRPAGGLGGRCKPPQRGTGRSPGAKNL